MTRRELLLLAAKAGGVPFAYGLMEHLGMLEKPEPTDLEPLRGATERKGTVLVLGAGIAGMCAAYELENLGYRCRLLEARRRTGGRCYTVRGGDTVEEKGEAQTCEFEDGSFFNPGPMRVPWWHVTVDYCRKFGVPLAPFINVNEATYVLQTATGKLKGQKIRMRDAIADTTGYMAELVSRSVKSGVADMALSPAEQSEVLTFVTRYGFLDLDGKYRGARRRTYKNFVGAGPGKSDTSAPYAMADLFQAGIGGYFRFVNAMDQQSTMLELVGGIDKLARAFERRVRAPIQLGCEVTEVKTSADGVVVTYKDASGDLRHASADYCVCTIPLPILKRIPSNFDEATKAAIARTFYANSTKVATEYHRRFWEEDERIFGGISWTDLPIGQIVYPSHSFFSRSGVLVNYTLGQSGRRLADLPPGQRVQAALDQTSEIHPQAKGCFKSGVTVSWANVPFSEGAFVSWEFTPGGEDAYQRLCRPQGRLYFAGEHASRVTAWMAGAIESARYVVKQIAIDSQQTRPAAACVPNLLHANM